MLIYLGSILGFVLLIKSADWLVTGSSSLAARFKVPPLVIGLTIVAFGTSFPELIVNLFASIQNNVGIATGNIIGSNIANILLILGAAAIIYPLKVQSSTVWKEIPFSLLATGVLWVLIADKQLNQNLTNVISLGDGIILLFFFSIFLYYMAAMAKNGASYQESIAQLSVTKILIYIMLGLGGLFLGGKLVVNGAVAIALLFGVSDTVVGLTVVAVGTSLPELVTSCLAAFRKQADIAIGNVIGSNIFNIFWILGVSSLIRPLTIEQNLNIDMGVLGIASLLMFLFLFVGKKYHLTRWEGIIFLTTYVSYVGWNITIATSN